ncbi:MAG: FAD-binding oxidoreductase [Deltaproteobacteria bacterium]|nr:FAD-binding oxidoreductase [Deltaproteobacteria bacterium]
MRRRLCGWGRYPTVEAFEIEGEDLEAITRDVVLSRGLGRSYGDASLPPPGPLRVAATHRADRILSFDPTTAVLRAQAGLSLERLNRFFLERGYFSPVTPGTEQVTLGGMVAADVHGKNHHVAGTIGAHVRALRLRLPDGTIHRIDPASSKELFDATIGGMGLTGHILEVELCLEKIPSPWIVESSQLHGDLECLIDGLRQASGQWPFTVAWADLMARAGGNGRGILLQGRWADAAQARAEAPRRAPHVTIPCAAPRLMLSNPTIACHNALRMAAARRAPQTRLTSPQRFFYPLDAIRRWNLLYGRRGMTQYQCVLPWDAGMASYRRLVDIARRHGPGPFLCVIKDCGAAGDGRLSFPMPGISFAMDFPVAGGITQALVDDLNDHVAAAGGRIYLAKDAFTRREHFQAMEPRLGAWRELRNRVDPRRHVRSALSERLLD